MADQKHIARVRQELRRVGVTRYGMTKLTTKYLPELLKKDEKIGGVVYGWVRAAGSAMLVATDRRVIFIDRKPFFTSSDELTYDVVSGVRMDAGGPFASVTLHTRVNDYALRYVNPTCAKNFVEYIEQRRIEPGVYDPVSERFESKPELEYSPAAQDSDAMDFLRSHSIGVLSTVSRTGLAHGSVIHYSVHSNGRIYFLTKSDTRKARNIFANQQVALTVFEEAQLRTALISGTAAVEQDEVIRKEVFTHMTRHRTYGSKLKAPPVVSLRNGAFVVIRIDPVKMELTNYSKVE